MAHNDTSRQATAADDAVGAVSVGAGDVVIVGAGLAGLFTALKLAPLPVTVVSAAPLGQGASSVWAQGGIAAAVGEGDSAEAHAADTITAGAGIVDAQIAHMVASEAGERIRDLLRYGVPFDRDLAGHFVLSREAAHSANRVVRVSGDRAGAAIMQALIAAVRATPSIRVLEGYEACGLVTEPDEVVAGGAQRVVAGGAQRVVAEGAQRVVAEGAQRVVAEGAQRVVAVRVLGPALEPDGSDADTTEGQVYELRPTRAVVLATGGVGALFAVTTNPTYACGIGIALAAEAGARIADAEFVQFHPTALDVGRDPAPLASEALRGEGAILVNTAGERFMLKLHPDAELAPRDVVARGVFAEVASGRGAFLDCRSSIGAHFPQAFPTVYAYAQDAGLDPVTQLLPVAPAEHYHMGGVETDARGRTSVAGLWAVGEVAATGLHGANRLASNSLLEAVVLGARVAADIAALPKARTAARVMLRPAREAGVTPLPPRTRVRLISELRGAMSSLVGVVRERDGLERALATVRRIGAEAKGDVHLAAMALTAEFVAGGALLREESRGGHYRSDFPEPNPRLAHRCARTLADLRAATKPKAAVRKAASVRHVLHAH